MSVGDAFTEVNFEEAKSTLIIGENGAGKSTLIEALVYALYGKPFRNIKLPQLINSINRKGLLVEVEFTVMGKEYLIRRGMKPNVFEIFENDTLINQVSGPRAYQEYLEAYILKMSYKSFIHIVILGAANFTSFMELTAADRRKITEEFIDLDIFSIMNKLLSDRVKRDKDIYGDTRRDLESLGDRIDEKNKSIETITAAKDATLASFDEQIATATAKAEEIGSIIADLEKQMKPVDKKRQTELREEIMRISRELTLTDAEITNQNKIITDMAEGDVCSACGQLITQEHKESEIDKANGIIVQQTAKAMELEFQLETIRDESAAIERVDGDNRAISAKLNGERARAAAQLDIIMRLTASKKKLEDDSANVDAIRAEVAELESQYDTLEAKFDALTDTRDVYEYAGALLKDSGIKARIIKQYVPILNATLNKYLTTLALSVSFEIDEEFRESVKSRYQDEFTYASFSEGEKARIDLALLFTWRALAQMRNKGNTNLLILDEVFDGSLDANGGDDLLAIIEEDFAQGRHIFVITHKSDAYVERFDRVMRVRKRQNFSEMKVAA